MGLLAYVCVFCACRDPEYLVKYLGRSHIHNEWVPESTLLQIAKRKVKGFFLFRRKGKGGEGTNQAQAAAQVWS